jgi:hypothetical protein
MRSEYEQLHGRALAEPVENDLTNVRRLLHRRYAAHVGEVMFRVFASKVRAMDPLAAILFLRDDISVEAELRKLEFAPNRVPGGRVAYASTAGADETATPSVEDIARSPYRSAARVRFR